MKISVRRTDGNTVRILVPESSTYSDSSSLFTEVKISKRRRVRRRIWAVISFVFFGEEERERG